MQNGGDDAGQDGAVQAAAVHDGIVVEQRRMAHGESQQDAQGCAVRKVTPSAVSSFPQDHHFSFPLGVEEGIEPAHAQRISFTLTPISRRSRLPAISVQIKNKTGRKDQNRGKSEQS